MDIIHYVIKMEYKIISVGDVELPNKPLSNFELLEAVKRLKISNFREVYLRDTLPKRALKNECGILNLDDSTGNGTHWVAWFKKGRIKYYFDSFGIQPPLELQDYLKSFILYNTEQIQSGDQVFCGHLCLHVLKQLSAGIDFQLIINDLH